jgi:hypothetical protein
VADELEEESMLAALGLARILDGTAKLWKYRLQDAAALPQRIRTRVLKFMASDKLRDAVDLPAFDYADVLKRFQEGQTDEQAAALLAAVPDPDLATEMAARANVMLGKLEAALPRPTRGDEFGAGEVDPDPGTLADFRRVWQVACDPMAVLDDLEDGSLSPDQVIALAELYPAIYQEMRLATKDALATMQARRGPKWEMPTRKAQLLGVLMQQDATDPEMAAAVQQIYAQDAQQQAAQAPKPGRARSGGADVGSELTPGQKQAGAA